MVRGSSLAPAWTVTGTNRRFSGLFLTVEAKKRVEAKKCWRSGKPGQQAVGGGEAPAQVRTGALAAFAASGNAHGTSVARALAPSTDEVTVTPGKQPGINPD